MNSSQTPHRSFHRLSLFLLVGMFIALGLFTSHATAARDSQSTQTPTPTPLPSVRLKKPAVLPNVTDQVNLGAQKYWGVCMACHGDRGQGLTDEWRAVYGQDGNCWTSGCHDKRHPSYGFEIPKTLVIPAIAGPGRLSRFANAQQLYDFIYANMPWWKPGALTSDEAWALTAQLLRMNGTWPQNLVIGPTNATAISVHYLAAEPTNNELAAWILAGVLGLAALGLAAQSKLEQSYATVEATRPPRPNFFHHLHPPSIPALQARWRYTLGAGGIAIFLSLVLLVTGIFEMFYYSPSPDKAAISVETINYLIPFGRIIRGLHFWSAQALVIVASIHLLRVIFTGAYAGRRRLNFLIGLGMLVTILLFDFTGYLLRWDEGIRWALVVGTNLLKTIPWIGEEVYRFVVGGPTAGPSSLVRFYSWHIFALTLLFIVLTSWHIFRVRRDGGIAVPPPTQRDDAHRITRFELLNREVIAMVIVSVILLGLVALLPAPIAQPITDNAQSVTEARAPWFFLWVQQLLKLGNPFIWGVLTPVLVMLVLAILPYVFPSVPESELGKWFPRGGTAVQILVFVLAAIILFLTLLAILPT